MISIFSLLGSVILSRSLYVVADFNIAEILKQSPMNIQELAQKLECDCDVLTRFMSFLSLHDVFKKNDKNQFCLTDFSETMCQDHPQTIKPFLLHDDATRWNSYGHLGYSIKTGKAAFDKLYGMDYFSHLAQNKELNDRFNTAMTVISEQEDALIAERILFNGTVTDIGGGKGQLLSKILEKNNSVKPVLFDLPEVVTTIENLDKIISVQPGSFFEPLTITSDCFILKRILHDWDDQKALLILNNINNAMDENATLYVVEGILDYSNNKELLAAIDLALLAIFKGKERTLNEFKVLYEKSNLIIKNIYKINDIVCVMECKKIVK